MSCEIKKEKIYFTYLIIIGGYIWMAFEKYRILPSRLVGSGDRDYDVFKFNKG